MPFVFVVLIQVAAARIQDRFQGNGSEVIGLLASLPEFHASAASLERRLTQPFLVDNMDDLRDGQLRSTDSALVTSPSRPFACHLPGSNWPVIPRTGLLEQWRRYRMPAMNWHPRPGAPAGESADTD